MICSVNTARTEQCVAEREIDPREGVCRERRQEKGQEHRWDDDDEAADEEVRQRRLALGALEHLLVVVHREAGPPGVPPTGGLDVLLLAEGRDEQAEGRRRPGQGHDDGEQRCPLRADGPGGITRSGLAALLPVSSSGRRPPRRSSLATDSGTGAGVAVLIRFLLIWITLNAMIGMTNKKMTMAIAAPRPGCRVTNESGVETCWRAPSHRACRRCWAWTMSKVLEGGDGDRREGRRSPTSGDVGR